MSRLSSFKEWLSISDASEALSKWLNEDVEISDIYSLINNKQLDCYLGCHLRYGVITIENLSSELKAGAHVMGTGFQKVSYPLIDYDETAWNGVQYYLRTPYIVVGDVKDIETGKHGINEWQLDQNTCMDIYIKSSELRNIVYKASGLNELSDNTDKAVVDNTQMQSTIDQLEKKIEELQKIALSSVGQDAEGISFPYVTPELEVMLTMVDKHWRNYVETLAKPLQKTIKSEIAGLLNISSESAKAEALASSIQPLQYRGK